MRRQPRRPSPPQDAEDDRDAAIIGMRGGGKHANTFDELLNGLPIGRYGLDVLAWCHGFVGISAFMVTLH